MRLNSDEFRILLKMMNVDYAMCDIKTIEEQLYIIDVDSLLAFSKNYNEKYFGASKEDGINNRIFFTKDNMQRAFEVPSNIIEFNYSILRKMFLGTIDNDNFANFFNANNVFIRDFVEINPSNLLRDYTICENIEFIELMNRQGYYNYETYMELTNTLLKDANYLRVQSGIDLSDNERKEFEIRYSNNIKNTGKYINMLTSAMGHYEKENIDKKLEKKISALEKVIS